MADIPAPPPGPLIAPLFLANSLNWMLFGIFIAQIYFYTQNFVISKEPIKVRLLVGILIVLELVQTATSTHQAWWYGVTNWNNPSALLEFPWSAMTLPTMSGLISAVVQIFFAWRIWKMSRAVVTRIISVLVVLLALAQSITAVVTGIIFQMNANPIFLQHLHPEFAFWLAGSFVADVLIAGCMLWILYTAKSQSHWTNTSNLLGRLVVVTAGTGTILALFGALTLALFVTTVGANFQYLPAAYIMGKLYSNSAMVSLNSRKARKQQATDSGNESGSFPMRIRVSRQVLRAGGGSQHDITDDGSASASKDGGLKGPMRSNQDLDMDFSSSKAPGIGDVDCDLAASV